MRRITFGNISRLVWAIVPVLMLWGALVGRAQTVVRPPMSTQALQNATSELEQKIRSSGVRGELQQLKPLAREQLIARICTFKPYAKNASRINRSPAPGSVPGDLAKLSPETQAVLHSAMIMAGYSGTGAGPRAALSQHLSFDHYCAVLEADEYGKNFRGAYYLADALITAAPDSDLRDLMDLAAARNLWLMQARESDYHLPYLNQACNSGNETIAKQARLWKEALTQPESPEGLLLTYQAWQALHNNQGFVEKGHRLADIMERMCPLIFESLRGSTRADGEKRFLMGRMVSIAAEMGYQLGNRKAIQWAVDAMSTLQMDDPEEALAPKYYLAYYKFSQGDHRGAVTAFEDVFFTNIPCDIAANAGVLMAVNHKLLNNPIAAKATLQVVMQLYSKQDFVLERAGRMLNGMKGVGESQSGSQVSEYIEKNFREKIIRVKAERNKNRIIQQAALSSSAVSMN